VAERAITKTKAERAPKTDALAKMLHENGIIDDQVSSIQPKQWRDLADSLGIKLPNDLGATIRETQTKVMKLQAAKAKKPEPTVFEPSKDLTKALQKPGAAAAAKAFYDAMGETN